MRGELQNAVESGDRRKILEALQKELAAAIEDTVDGTKIAALSLRLIQVTEALDAIPTENAEDDYDQLAERRRARLSNAEDPMDAGELPVRRRQGGRRTRFDGRT